MKSSTAHLLLIIAAMLWSLGGVFIKMVDLHPIALSGARSFVAALVLLIYIRRPKFIWNKFMIMGVLAYAATVLFFVASTKLTTAANAIILQFTSPIHVVIFGYFMLKERVTKLDWFAMIIIFMGLGLFFMDELTFQGFWGNILALCSGVSFALVTVIVRKEKGSSSFEIVFLGNILTALIALPFLIPSLPYISPTDGWIIVLLGVVQLGIPYILFTKALKYVPAIDAILLGAIEPILNPVWVFLFIGETVGEWALTGGVLVIAGSIGRSYLKNRKVITPVHQ
ncbi:MAG: EamA family transporter [Candidatus Marinimicrobia bacterium]|nr:EamA family transporter [Candidatus Neomarinimicrobiota bacterium]MBL7010418.1 EamA family transporter [Candidatus Neomarinimicrobiota bacterium]MBL7030730.1 EamA family transporter [Candidatus Neomarinimicrobiota bacterium]